MTGIEAYLDRICDRLRGNPAEIADIHREIRLHLEDLIAGYCAEGMSRPEAAERAIASLGKAEQLRMGLDLVHYGDRAWVRRVKGVGLGGLLGVILSPLPGLVGPRTVADGLLSLAFGVCIGLLSSFRTRLLTGFAIGSLTWSASRVGALIAPFFTSSTSQLPVNAVQDVLAAVVIGGIFGTAIAVGTAVLLPLFSRHRLFPT